MPEIENWEQHSELEAMYEKARERLSGDGTLGSHYLLTSYLRERYGVTALGREASVLEAKKLLDRFETAQLAEEE